MRFLDHCLELFLAGELDATTAAMSKWWLTELDNKVLDTCLQLFGGYGYMLEYPIARAYADARVHRIYAGTTEICAKTRWRIELRAEIALPLVVFGPLPSRSGGERVDGH